MGLTQLRGWGYANQQGIPEPWLATGAWLPGKGRGFMECVQNGRGNGVGL